MKELGLGLVSLWWGTNGVDKTTTFNQIASQLFRSHIQIVVYLNDSAILSLSFRPLTISMHTVRNNFVTYCNLIQNVSV